MRKFLEWTLASMLGVWAIAMVYSLMPTDRYKLYETNTAMIQIGQGKESRVGTGTFLDHQLVLTNAHVWNSASTGYERIVLWNHDRSLAWTAELVRVSEAYDLALLRVNGGNAGAEKLEVYPKIRRGTNIHSAGYGSGAPLTFKRGIAGYTLQGDWMLNFTLNGGDSGSPIFDDSNRLVGIAVAQWYEGTQWARYPAPNLGLGIHGLFVEEFLNEEVVQQ